MIFMLTKNGRKLKGCQHNWGLINHKCVKCGLTVNLRKYKFEKAFVEESPEELDEKNEILFEM